MEKLDEEDIENEKLGEEVPNLNRNLHFYRILQIL